MTQCTGKIPDAYECGDDELTVQYLINIIFLLKVILVDSDYKYA